MYAETDNRDNKLLQLPYECLKELIFYSIESYINNSRHVGLKIFKMCDFKSG